MAISLCLAFGGRSCEHEVSVISARSILQALDQQRYQLHFIAIAKDGGWYYDNQFDNLVVDGVVSGANAQRVVLDPNQPGHLLLLEQVHKPIQIDVVFPVLHGPYGEDGSFQGALEQAQVAYVGCGVAASALAMDKALCKEILAQQGIAQTPHQIVLQGQWQDNPDDVIQRVSESLTAPYFVKPANMGSSVGIHKVNHSDGLTAAIDDALRFDQKLVIESGLEGYHEVEVAVLGNEAPRASVVGEIIPGDEFYSYETKYLDDRSQTLIPARISEQASAAVQRLALQAFLAIAGSGLARIDFFVAPDGQTVLLNEINTLPGFTPISMYPKLWQASDIAYADLIERLILLAQSRFQARQALTIAL